MASLDRELTAGPTPPPARRWSEYTQLSRQIKQASLLDRRHGYYTAKISLNLVLLARPMERPSPSSVTDVHAGS
jgi:hypothetical protein